MNQTLTKRSMYQELTDCGTYNYIKAFVLPKIISIMNLLICKENQYCAIMIIHNIKNYSTCNDFKNISKNVCICTPT